MEAAGDIQPALVEPKGLDQVGEALIDVVDADGPHFVQVVFLVRRAMGGFLPFSIRLNSLYPIWEKLASDKNGKDLMLVFKFSRSSVKASKRAFRSSMSLRISSLSSDVYKRQRRIFTLHITE